MTEREDELGCRIWRRHAAGRRSVPGGPELAPDLLAAYLDGKADPEAVERIEAQMADDPELLAAVLELRRLREEPTPPAPPAVTLRAKNLFAPATPKSVPAMIAVGRWWARLQWAAAAIVIVVAGLGGYSFGGDTFTARQIAQRRTASRMTLEIDELIAEPDLSVSTRANGAKGEES